MSQAIIEAVEKKQLKTDLPRVSVGDTVVVHVRIIEGSKERVQQFEGVVIKIQGRGISQSMTVRKIVANEGVERSFPLNSPRVAKVEVKRHAHTRRARLFFLRDRVGKKRRLRDRRRGLAQLEGIIPGAKKKKKKKKAADQAPEVPAPVAQEPTPAEAPEAESSSES